MESRIDTLLVLALPVSGRCELRRYLASVNAEVATRDFGLGPTVQLDDYPYVHLMRRINEEIIGLGGPPVFYASNDGPFLDGGDWATLVELVNEDCTALGTEPSVPADVCCQVSVSSVGTRATDARWRATSVIPDASKPLKM